MDSSAELSLELYPTSVRESLEEAIQFQQNLYELSSDWNFYEEDQHSYLKQNIRYALFGLPDDEDSTRNKETEEKKRAAEAKTIENIYHQILEASRSKKSLYVGIIFNVLCSIKESEKFVSPVPIFTVKRCIEREERSSTGRSGTSSVTKSKKIGETALYSCCVYYIDVEGRIYKNWTDYVLNNTLLECLMVLPTGGFYQANPYADNNIEKTFVWVEIGPSPAVEQITPYFDKACTVLGLGALGIGATALAAPALLAAPVLIAGTVCGTVSGAYTTVRSGQQLVDRHKHQQSINVTDKAARSAWFGIVGGVAGGLASGSTFLLSKAARAGFTLGVVTRSTYNAIAIGNIVVNGAGIGNGLYGIFQTYNERKEISYLELGQVMAHILFFGNAVMNFQTAKTVITNSQRQVLQDYENSLRSNRHKKAFRRIVRNTQASSSDSISGDSEIIRGIRSIQNKDDFFAAIVRNRKVFSRANAEVTFKDGYATINDNIKFDPIELSQQPKRVRLNTVQAAEPFNSPRSNMSFSPPKTMAASTYNEEVNSAKGLIVSLQSLAQISYIARYIGSLIIELQEFTESNRGNIIAGLARIALRIIQENRRNITRAVDELMYYIWKAHVRPILDERLTSLELDTTRMSEIPALAELVYTIVQRIIDEIYDGIEHFLQEIIDGYSNSPLTLQPTPCNVCLGYPLSENE